MFTSRPAVALYVGTLLCVLAACSPGTGGLGDEPLTVGRDLMLFGSTAEGSYTGVAPLDIFMFVRPISGSADNQVDMSSKFEFNFGDGTGWIDLTQEYNQKVHGAHTSPPPVLDQLKHTYAIPGDYTVICRVTFSDGGVVLSSVTDPDATFHVLPPASG